MSIQSQNKQSSVAVIGAGYSGLATASLLAQKGYQVTVIEKNEKAGGRALARRHGDFQFDYGPSWYLMPEVFEHFFSLFQSKVEDHYHLVRLDPAYRVYFDKGDFVDVVGDYRKNRALFKQLETDGDKKLDNYLKQSQYQYEVAMEKFVYRDLREWKRLLDPQLLDGFLRLRILGSWHNLIASTFDSEKIHKLLTYPAGFLGSSPKSTPAMYGLMNYVDFKQGVWYPMGGMGAVALAIEKVAKKHGVRFLYNEAVTKIEIKGQEAKVIHTNKRKIESDIVVSASDYANTQLKLLPETKRNYSQKYWDSRVLAPSGFVVHLGLKKKLSGILHHTLFLLGNWDEHFDQVFSKPDWPVNPSFYICASSKTDPGIAPKDKDVLFLLVPVAADLADDPKIRKRFRDQIVAKASEILGENINEFIEEELIFSVNDFRDTYDAFKGTTFGLAHTLFQTAFFRPAFVNPQVTNLYYTGQYTHPGVGVPTALISAEIVANKIDEKYGQ